MAELLHSWCTSRVSEKLVKTGPVVAVLVMTGSWGPTSVRAMCQGLCPFALTRPHKKGWHVVLSQPPMVMYSVGHRSPALSLYRPGRCSCMKRARGRGGGANLLFVCLYPVGMLYKKFGIQRDTCVTVLQCSEGVLGCRMQGGGGQWAGGNGGELGNLDEEIAESWKTKGNGRHCGANGGGGEGTREKKLGCGAMHRERTADTEDSQKKSFRGCMAFAGSIRGEGENRGGWMDVMNRELSALLCTTLCTQARSGRRKLPVVAKQSWTLHSWSILLR